MRSDTTDKANGICLLFGTVAGLVTMALHPTHLNLSTSRDAFAASLWANAAVHSLAIAGLPLTLLGLRALTKRIGADDPLAGLAFWSYALGAASVLSAAVLSGFVATDLARESVGVSPDQTLLVPLLHYTKTLNGAFARVFVGLSAAAIVLWSLAGRRARVFEVGITAVGLIVGLAELAAVASGRVAMDVHGVGLLVLGQALWTILVAAVLMKPRGSDLAA